MSSEIDTSVVRPESKNDMIQTSGFAFEKPLKNITQNDVLLYVSEKIKKIHVAIYMVAKYIPSDDPLHNAIKKTSTNLLDMILVKDILDPALCSVLFMQSVVYMDKLIAEIETASMVGFVTMMNKSVLVGAIAEIRGAVTDYALATMRSSQDAPYVADSVAYFRIPADLLSTDTPPIKRTEPQSIRSNTHVADTQKAHTSAIEHTAKNNEPSNGIESSYKRQPANPLNDSDVVYTASASKPIQKNAPAGTPVSAANIGILNSRQEMLIKLLQTKAFVTINDITTSIKGVSEKTIQRDLTDLIQKGRIVRQGNKRWSTYQLKA